MRRVALAIAALLAIALVPVVTSAAPGSGAGGSDVREFDRKARRELVVSKQATRQIERSAASLPGPKAPPVVGEERFWLGLDDTEGAIYPKAYTLRGIGTNLEVWVASDEDDVSIGTDFPAGDCRNDGVRNVITDAQVQYLIDEFDSNMYPIESAAFSVAPPRNGARAPLAKILELPSGYYRGPGDRIVALIDNVRDDNFYDTDNASGFTYIGRLLLLGLRRPVQPTRDDDRRVRLAPPDGSQPAACAVVRPMSERAGPALPVRGGLRARVPAPARELRRLRRDDHGERGAGRLRPDDHRLRRPVRPDHGRRVRQPHPVLPRLQRRRDIGQPHSADPVVPRTR